MDYSLILSCNSIDDLSKGGKLIYKYEKHKNNRVASLIMDDNQYNEWVKNYEYDDLKELIKDIYKVFPNEYDIILLIINEDSLLSSFEANGIKIKRLGCLYDLSDLIVVINMEVECIC